MKRALFGWLVLLLAVGVVFLLRQASEDEDGQIVANLVSNVDIPGEFARAEKPVGFDFPTDFGPHPAYQTEWWYYTGNLETDNGRHFGYQLTFFRRALIPVDATLERDSQWATEQVYMAHFALTDVAADAHYDFERLRRGAAGLAGAQVAPYQVWLEDWRVETGEEADTYWLYAKQEDVIIELLLRDEKGPIPHGEVGYSQKGPERGNASYYYSQTRLRSSGTIRVGGKDYLVEGLSWKDHEYSTSALSDGQVGWDWFSVQLNDGTDLMFYQIRREDGSIDPFSSGTLIAPDGSTKNLTSADFQIEVKDTWRSPHSGAVYPARWSVSLLGLELELRIVPYVNDQEMNLSFIYWEGAVQVSGEYAGQVVEGSGYVEMTGYAASMEGEF